MTRSTAFDATTAHDPAATARIRPGLCTWQSTVGSAHIPEGMLRALAVAADLIVLVAAGLASRLVPIDAEISAAASMHWAAGVLTSLATVGLIALFGLHAKSALLAPMKAIMSRLMLALLLAFAGLSAFATQSGLGLDVYKLELCAWLLVSAASLVAARAGLAHIVRGWAENGRLERRVAIYGAGQPCVELIRRLKSDRHCDISVVGVCDDRGDDRVGPSVLGYPLIGTLDNLISLARTSRIDTIIVTLPLAAEQRLLQIFERLSVLPADVRQPATTTGVHFSRRAYDYIGRQPMLAILDNPIGDWGMVVKSALDKIVAAAALLLLAPVLAIIAVAIKLDSRGPVLFRQQRYGFNNELIEVLKFRSMYADKADVRAERLVSKGDPRVTAVGRFIRKSSLDELPQLLNVLSGELSLVGPRPHAVHAKAADRLYGDVVSRYFVRHKVKPGITGWAQINGWRGETDTEEKIMRRVEHDLYYIENWSLWLDLWILARTPFALLNTDSAY